MNDDGFIKIHRRMLKWEWYKDTNTKVLFLHCLLKANWKDGRFQGIEVPRGSFVTSLSTLSEELSSKEQTFTVQNVRTSLKHLTLTGELTSKSYSKYRIITVNKYNEYQVANIVPNKQLTNSQQATNKQLTTIEEKKEKKEIYNTNNKYAYTEKQFGRVLSATEKEEITKWPDTELTMYAIKQAMLYGKSNVKYISRIIEAYGRENIQTVQQAQQREREYAEAKKRKQEMKRNNGYQKNTKTIEPEPEWLNKKIKKQEVTSKEREEMDELLKEYK